MIQDLSITVEQKITEKTLMYLRGDSVQLVGKIWYSISLNATLFSNNSANSYNLSNLHSFDNI
jgi:hypothetical protein